MLTKEERLRQIMNAKNNFYLGLAALALFQDRTTYGPLDHLGVALSGTYGLNFRVVAQMLDHPEAGPDARQEFQLALLRMVLKEPYEVVRAFAKDHARAPQLRAQPWFHLARMLRNCVSHDFRFTLNPFDLSLLPVTWNGVEITAAVNGTYLTTEHCRPAFAKELVNAFETFVRSA